MKFMFINGSTIRVTPISYPVAIKLGYDLKRKIRIYVVPNPLNHHLTIEEEIFESK